MNPQRPLPYGLTPAFFNPVTGKWVKPDECDESDGALIEAKGPGFADNLKYEPLRNSFREGFLNQALAQVEAAGARPIRWYFAETETARFASEIFRQDKGIRDRIQVIVQEANIK